MELLNKLIEEAEDEECKKQFILLRYMYRDLLDIVTEKNQKLLDEYTDYLIQAFRPHSQSAFLPSSSKFKTSISQSFYEFLLRDNKSQYTAYDYVKRVERICRETNVTLEHLLNGTVSIDSLIDLYTTGDKAEEKSKLHNAPSSSLKQFKSFVIYSQK